MILCFFLRGGGGFVVFYCNILINNDVFVNFFYINLLYIMVSGGR